MATESGFSLIEVLVVTLIIGVLAAIALPAFLGPKTKAQDADAKTNVRNVVTAVESCQSATRTYSSCDSAAELGAAGAALAVKLTDPATQAKGAASVTASADGYTVVGYSHSGNTFSMVKAADGAFSRPCTSTADGGGCHTSAGAW